MQTKRKPLEKGVSPAGVAVWPRLNEPDTKFVDYEKTPHSKGVYRTGLRLKRDDPIHAAFIDDLTARYEANIVEQQKLNGKPGKKIKVADSPIKDVVDDEGNPTGEVDIAFKSDAFVKPKNKEGWDQEPDLFDAKGNPLGKNAKSAPRIGGGSTIRVSFFYNPYYTPAFGAGLSLRLRGVKVLNLVEFQRGSAQSHGFDEPEDGFEVGEGTSAQPRNVSTEGGDADTEPDF